MLRFTEQQMTLLRELAAPLAPSQRSAFLQEVARRLHGVESRRRRGRAGRARGAGGDPQGLAVVASVSTSHGEGRPEMSRKNTREWQVGRFWRDKPVRERITAKDVLTAAGLDVRDIRSRPEIDQPPDWVAAVERPGGHYSAATNQEQYGSVAFSSGIDGGV